jgi:Peptidase A4 family
MYHSLLTNGGDISGGAAENGRPALGEALFASRRKLNVGYHRKIGREFGGSIVSALLLTAVCATAQVAPPTIPTNVPSIKALPALPAGFDALSASPEELQSHAFPPKPDQTKDPVAYNAWKTLAQNAKTNVSATLVEQPNIFHKPAQLKGSLPQPSAGSKNPTLTSSYNWSGLTIVDSNKPFAKSYILGDWTVPAAHQTFGSPDGTWDYSSQWVGIDGFGSNDVFQAGTEADALANSGGGSAQYYSFWIEWFPYSEARVSGFPLAPGDTVIVEVFNTTPTNGYAFLENLSTGKYVEFNLTPPSGYTLQGNSAEWVVERPEVNGALARLMNYASVPFTYMHAAGFNDQVVYYPGTDYTPTGTVYSIDMLDNSGKEISYPVVNGIFGMWCFDTGSAF